MQEHYERGREAALLIWSDEAAAGAIDDPRLPAFAEGVMAGLASSLKAAPGLMRRVVNHAAAAAEDLNVEAFQGLVEVLQNADDLGATTVRFGLDTEDESPRLLIVHDGAPVTCHHVLAMTLPYLTTKSGDADQKGRFGIGLKTLKRISNRISIHSAPYHFSADGLDLIAAEPAKGLPGFYDPERDTLLELDLVQGFVTDALAEWFDAWDEDGLLFLKSVRRFAWHDFANGIEQAKSVEPGDWERIAGPTSEYPALDRRVVLGSGGAWTVYRSRVPTPEGLGRSHKATGAMTAISVALADHLHTAGLFIGFRTRIPVSLPFSIDAQFDPSTAREGLIDNKWNRWLLARCGEVIAAIGVANLLTKPCVAWATIPTSDEGVGLEGERWPRAVFAEALGSARKRIAEDGAIQVGDQAVALSSLAYEDADLEHLLSSEDLRLLWPELTPLAGEERDANGRWRAVLDDLGVATCVDTDDLVRGFSADLFRERPVGWWIDAAACLAKVHPDDEIFGVPCWLTDQNQPTACHPRGETARHLLIGEPLSEFARRWQLFERLHDAYRDHPSGGEALEWLNRQAAVAATVDAADELAAFAEMFADEPIAVGDADLATIRDRFDLLTDRRAEPLGPKVGQALLLDGFVYRSGKRAEVKVSPTAAYLSRTLDSDFPHWPDAAGTLPGMTWLASSYDLRLKTGATRSQRKRADGTISRGPRKFLLLLGAMCSPRLVKTGKKVWGGAYRTQELRALKTEFVQEDYASPDLDRVISSLERASKKDRRAKSAALLKALSRHWEAYTDHLTVNAYHEATKYIWHRGQVAAEWLAHLHEASWVAVGTGTLTTPSHAVIRSSQTQTIYAPEDFTCGVTPEDVRPAFAATLKLITDVRASDLVGFLEQSRASPDGFDPVRVQQAYRSLAKLCPSVVGWNSKVGDLQINELRHRFSAGEGLIWVPSPDGKQGNWRRPEQLFVGKDIFLDPERFVPGGPSCQDLWNALQVRKPTLDACIAALRDLSTRPYSSASEAVLIEVYRYIEPLVSRAERKHRERLRSLPVGVVGAKWSRGRPVYQLADRELRLQLAMARPDLEFWTPPCDVHALPNLCAALGLTACSPTIEVLADAGAKELGEVLAPHFQRCVDHLSNELARNDPVTRERLEVSWPTLREINLSAYQQPFGVLVRIAEISAQPVRVPMRAVLHAEPLTLHVEEHAFAQRENCGRAIASLFPPDAQRRIEAEWVASWVASSDETVELMPTASDEEHARALADRAAAMEVSPGKKIKVTPPASRSAPKATPRRLKAAHGGVTSVTIVGGSPPKAAGPPKAPLATTPPPAPAPPAGNPSAPPEYTTADLEQRGWEILADILNGSQEADLVDFRRRHRVGADGVIDWKTFVELKATGRGPQSSIEMSATEFERARERGLDFILALVSGVEEGFRTEVRLILDPANRATVRPVGSVRLVALTDAPSILLHLGDLEHEASPDFAEKTANASAAP